MTRRMRVPTSAAAAALAVATIITACGSGAPVDRHAVGTGHAAHTEHALHHAGSEGDDDGVLEVTARDDAFISEHATVAAGTMPVTFTNAGTKPHQLQIGHLKDPMAPEEFVALLEDEGDRATVDALTWVGGVNVIDPGETGSATVELTEGDYLMVCYVPDDDGTSHLMHGMVAALHVSAAAEPATGSDRAEPTETVLLRDYQITLPPGFRGHGPVAFRNEGTDPHEVVLLRLDEGKTIADAAAYQADSTMDQPFTFAGGIASVAPGTEAIAELDLEPGDYLATCFVPAADGTPHVDLGMVATFTVPGA